MATSCFITNQSQKNLRKRLVELIKHSKELKFLVGFFYFSGIKELYEGLKNNPNIKLDILVGLNVDKKISNLIEYADNDQISDEEKADRYLDSTHKSLNSDELDNPEFHQQITFFKKLIKDNRLRIRKTFHPNHSKVYITRLNKSQVKNELFITGSSNLTKAGLTTRDEFNVEIGDFGFKDAEKYFDKLWDEAVPITEDDILKQKLLDIIENKSPLAKVTPFEAFVLVLKTYLESFKEKEISQSRSKIFTDKGYINYEYQTDSVKQALSIIEDHQGVLIADVVGLGKSIIASRVAVELGDRGIIICPPGLVGDENKKSGWKKYAEDFGLYDWEVRSRGNMEKILEFINKTPDIKTVIIDEAHRFRNEDTQDYEHLKNICRGKKVILLTATPFNNKPEDILALLQLFITPKQSSISLESDLKTRFRIFNKTFEKLAFIKKNHNSPNSDKTKKAKAYYQSLFQDEKIDLKKVKQRAHYLSSQIRHVIEPVTIRRNRLDLINNPHYKNEVANLSKFEDPKEWYFTLSKDQSLFYDQIVKDYFADPDENGKFKGAIYRPFQYTVEKKKIKDEKLDEKENIQYWQQKNLYDFMRRLLVKRFESSFGAFEQSLKNFKKTGERALRFIETTNRYILDRKLLDKILNMEDDEEIEQAFTDFQKKLATGNFPKNNKIYYLDKFTYKNQFIKDIKSDIKLFDEILNKLNQLELVKHDPKSAELIKKLKVELSKKSQKNEPKRKIIIFTEYLATAKYLEKILEKSFKNKILTIAGKLPQTTIDEINENFDASNQKQSNDYQILLSTDRISEGFNLNRAGLVINYDIPWNPVRVIQRVGRVNRIAKKVFNSLYIANFFPTEQGASIIRIKTIAQNKMFLIHNTLGEDAKIFDIDEEPTAARLFNRIQTNPDNIQEESFYTSVVKEYESIKKKHPGLIKKLDQVPEKVKVSKQYKEPSQLVFIRKGRLYIREADYQQDEKNRISSTTLEEIYPKIKCGSNQKSLPLSKEFWPNYLNVKQFKEEVSPLGPNSIEVRALNNLNSLLQKYWPGLKPYLPFLRTLKEDIVDFGTLPNYTLRKIEALKVNNSSDKKTTLKNIKALQAELGHNYLEKEKAKLPSLPQEIIIAIENQK